MKTHSHSLRVWAAFLSLALMTPAVQAFNNDGHTDILWRNYSTLANDAWAMNGSVNTGTISLPATTGTGASNWKMVGTGDFNHDHQLDILWYHVTYGMVAIWLMNGNNIIATLDSAQDPDQLPWVTDTGWEAVGTGYFDGPTDKDVDILWRHKVTGHNAIWQMSGTKYVTSFSESQGLPTVDQSSGWQIGGTGDFDLDGHTDIFWRNYLDGENALWFMNGHAYVTHADPPPDSNYDLNWEIVGINHFDSDSSTDLLWRHKLTGEVGLWFLGGYMRMYSSSVGYRSLDWKIGGTGDSKLNSDFDLLPDLWERNYFGNDLVLEDGWNDPDGDGLTNAQEYTNGGNPTLGIFATALHFAGINQNAPQAGVPADPTGAVGPNHFIQFVNTAVAIYDKSTGTQLKLDTLENFFALDLDGNGTAEYHPNVADSHIIYDPDSQRWIACTMDQSGSKAILLAVSKRPNPVGTGNSTWIEDHWRKYRIDFARPGYNLDYPTLGVDKNGIYIGVDYFVAQVGNTPKQGIAAIWKDSLVGPNPPVSYELQGAVIADSLDGSSGELALQPAVNFDANPVGGVAWFVTALSSGSYIRYYRVTWNAAHEAQWEQAFPAIQIPYAAGQLFAKQPSPGPDINVKDQAHRLMMAMTRTIGGNTYLWTCRTAAMDYTGSSSNGANDRVGCVWYKFKIKFQGSSYILSDEQVDKETGRVFDNLQTSIPKHYYMPSLAVNSRGDMLLGFSGSSANLTDGFIGTYYAARLATDPPGNYPLNYLRAPQQYHAGEDIYGRATWGDYTYTSVDPTDGITFWTNQQYAKLKTANDKDTLGTWGTWVGKINPF